MNKKVKILIIGFGSIGRRHFNNLVKLGYNNISFLVGGGRGILCNL